MKGYREKKRRLRRLRRLRLRRLRRLGRKRMSRKKRGERRRRRRTKMVEMAMATRRTRRTRMRRAVMTVRNLDREQAECQGQCPGHTQCHSPWAHCPKLYTMLCRHIGEEQDTYSCVIMKTIKL